MNRTAWLQDRRMEKFCDVLSRWKARELSAQEAGEILGCSERQFRRYRRRYEQERLTGLFDQRLGKASVRRVPIDKVAWMLSESFQGLLEVFSKHGLPSSLSPIAAATISSPRMPARLWTRNG